MLVSTSVRRKKYNIILNNTWLRNCPVQSAFFSEVKLQARCWADKMTSIHSESRVYALRLIGQTVFCITFCSDATQVSNPRRAAAPSLCLLAVLTETFGKLSAEAGGRRPLGHQLHAASHWPGAATSRHSEEMSPLYNDRLKLSLPWDFLVSVSLID